MRPVFFKIAFLALLVTTLAGCSITRAMRTDTREIIDVKTMISDLNSAPLVFVGERHDTASHHELQLEILKAKLGQGKPLAIGMEMFEDASQRELDDWSVGDLAEYRFRRLYEMSWRHIPYELYRDIFLFARDNHIPIIGLNAPRGLVQKVAQHGFASLTEKELGQLPKGIDAQVSDAYLSFIKIAYSGHGRMGEAFRNICEAQMLRNRVMARHITDYFAAHPDATMVVLAGGGHARMQGGIPAELANISYKIVLPPIPSLTSSTVTRNDGDYLLEEPFFWLGEIL